MYPKTESNTPINTGGGMIESHSWIEIPLKLDNQIIHIKALVCDLECPYDICRATGMEECPKVTLDIQCLRRGGGAALTMTINYFLHREVMAVHGL